MANIENIANAAQALDLRGSQKPKTNRQAPVSDQVEVQRVDNGKGSGLSAEVQTVATKQDGQSTDNRAPFDRAAEIIAEIIPETDKGLNTRLRINKDDETGQFVYQSVDNETGKVIKQFPPETIQEMLSSYRSLEGLAFDNTV